jgi:iron complex transport system ATP-binding protein
VLAYDQRLVVEDLSLAIPRAGSVIVEPNACGKSTLLRALARLLIPKAGTVHLDGRQIHQMPSRDVATRLGILPQSPTLDSPTRSWSSTPLGSRPTIACRSPTPSPQP